jgi:putative ABC transport system permease protein
MYLLGIQVALAACVAVGSGLMLRSMDRLLRVDPGLQDSGVLTFRPNPPGSRYPDRLSALAYYEAVLERIRSLPDVESVGAINLLPGTSGTWNFPTIPEGVEYPEGTPPTSINFRAVLPGYSETVQVPLVSGRYLESSDRDDAERVVVVNQAFVDLFWPGELALGKHLRLFESTARPFRVVGVVGNVRQHSRAEQPKPEMYFTAQQWGQRLTLWMMVRFRDGTTLHHPGAIKEAIWSLDSDVPITGLQDLSTVMRSSTQTTGFIAIILSIFGSMALALGAVGVFGVTAFTVRRRRPEYGVRIALGASRLRLLCSAVAQSLGPAAVGLVAGLAGALAFSDVMKSVLFEVQPTDPATFAGVAFVLLGTAALASAFPAWRASGVDPVEVLNSE